jgi:hypothetical protein
LGIALSTVSNFINSKPVFVSTFERICEKLNLDKQEIKSVQSEDDARSEKPLALMNFSVYDSSWVGREKILAELTDKLRSSCRLLLVLGLTGIGKTALAER